MAQQFHLPAFYPILDTAALAKCGCGIQDAANVLLDAGVKLLQFRHKNEWTQQEFDQAVQISSLCKEAGCQLIVNDRADYAQLTDAGLHIGQDDLSPAASRKVIGKAIIGLSTHNRAQIEIADEEPVDYIALGPIFPTDSKLKPDPVLGVEKFGKLRKLTNKPVVAIGGIRLENAADVLAAGASSVATISGFLNTDLGGIAKNAREWVRLTAQHIKR